MKKKMYIFNGANFYIGVICRSLFVDTIILVVTKLEVYALS